MITEMFNKAMSFYRIIANKTVHKTIKNNQID